MDAALVPRRLALAEARAKHGAEGASAAPLSKHPKNRSRPAQRPAVEPRERKLKNPRLGNDRQCRGRDSNSRNPSIQDPESCAFDRFR